MIKQSDISKRDKRIEELEAQLAEVLKEGTFDGWDLGSAINRLDELEAQLAEQLEYIAHKPYCKWYDTSVNAVERVLHCDCGLQAIINREKEDAGT